MPVRDGEITVMLTRKNKNISGEINLPKNLSGELKWNGKTIALHAGSQKIAL